MNFKLAVNQYTYTENGALTHNTSGNACLDFFGMGGALRDAEPSRIISLFNKAFDENPEYALRTLLYLRDIRKGGMGEKNVYRVIIRDMLDKGILDVNVFADITIEYGSWKDIFAILTVDEYIPLIKRELNNRVFTSNYKATLMEKYMPSIGGSKNRDAEKVADALCLTPKAYRKYLAKARAEINIVEQKMCANDWNEIQYAHVPSKAMLNYKSAFRRHSPDKFNDYIESVNKGETKINTGTLYPYDIVRKVFNGDKDESLDTLWNNLKDYECDGNSIVVCDVSGSMTCDNSTPISVAISLATYFAERNTGKFKGQMITFSEKPSFFEIPNGTIFDKVKTTMNAPWGMSTDLQAVFKLLLDACTRENVPQEEMPKNIYIVSDMEFNEACRGKTNFDAIKEKYAEAGYEMPNLIFWNVNSHQNNLPVSYDDNGVALVSGCSPAIFAQTVTGNLDPIQFMLDAIMKPQYDCALNLVK